MAPTARRVNSRDKGETTEVRTITRVRAPRRVSGPFVRNNLRSSNRINRSSQSVSSTSPNTSNFADLGHQESERTETVSTSTVIPQESSDVSVVDLVSPTPTPIRQAVRQPVEVDLTCDIDDEVFVLLEDIVNPYRPGSDLPVILGGSPPRTRTSAARSRRQTSRVRITSSIPISSEISHNDAPLSASSPSAMKDNTLGISCPICLDTLAQIKSSNRQLNSTTCGHLFCGPCITRVITNTHQCPSCRQPLTLKKIHPIFI